MLGFALVEAIALFALVAVPALAQEAEADGAKEEKPRLKLVTWLGYGDSQSDGVPPGFDVPVYVNIDNPAFEEGNLLLSARMLDAIFVLDPKLGRVVWAQRRPWLRQHDPPLGRGPGRGLAEGEERLPPT